MKERELDGLYKEYIRAKEMITKDSGCSGRRIDYLMLQLLILWRLNRTRPIFGDCGSLTKGLLAAESGSLMDAVRWAMAKVSGEPLDHGATSASPMLFWEDIEGLELEDRFLYLGDRGTSGAKPLLNIIEAHDTGPGSYDGFFIGSFFEMLINSDSRKEGGQYYTPREITSHICHEAISLFLLDRWNELCGSGHATLEGLVASGDMNACKKRCLDVLLGIGVLDPACGTGHFLESAYLELKRIYQDVFAAESPHGYIVRTDIGIHIIERNLYGIDISSGAARLAAARLAMLLYEDGKLPNRVPSKNNLCCGNALVGIGMGGGAPTQGRGASPAELDRQLAEALYGLGTDEAGAREMGAFHWEIGFPDRARDRFDVVVGNPPYGKIKNMKVPLVEKERLSKTYKRLYGMTGTNIDTYKLFIERCLGLLGEKGYLSLVIPGMFWGDKDSLALRRELFSRGLRCIIQFPLKATKELFGGKVSYEVSVFIMGGGHEKADDIIVFSNVGRGQLGRLRASDGSVMSRKEILGSSKLWRIPSFRHGREEREIFRHLGRIGKLGRLCNEGKLSIFVGKLDETIDKRYLSDNPTGDLAIASNHIKDWYVDTVPRQERKRWILDASPLRNRRLKKGFMGAGTVGELMDVSPKIIGRQMANRGEARKLHFALHYGNEMLTNGVRTLMLNDADTRMHKTMLSHLNSNLLNWYFSLYSHTYNVKPYELEDLPIPKPTDVELNFYGALSDMMMFAVASSREGASCLEQECALLSRLLNASVYDRYLFSGNHGIIGLAHDYLHELNFEAWSLSLRRERLGAPAGDAGAAEKMWRESMGHLLGAVSDLAGDAELASAMDAIHSEGWVRCIEGSGLAGPK